MHVAGSGHGAAFWVLFAVLAGLLVFSALRLRRRSSDPET